MHLRISTIITKGLSRAGMTALGQQLNINRSCMTNIFRRKRLSIDWAFGGFYNSTYVHVVHSGNYFSGEISHCAIVTLSFLQKVFNELGNGINVGQSSCHIPPAAVSERTMTTTNIYLYMKWVACLWIWIHLAAAIERKNNSRERFTQKKGLEIFESFLKRSLHTCCD